MKLKLLLGFACAPLLSGCISFSGLDPNSNYADLGDSSIIVMGVSQRYRIHIFKGERKGDSWFRDQVMVTLNTYPEEGFIVAKMRPRTGNDVYGIYGILPEGIGTGGLYLPCNGNPSMTFQAPAGQVVYVGDLDLGGNSGRRIAAGPNSKGFTAARAHLQRRFPALAERLVYQGFDYLKTDTGLKERNLNCR